jgi:hypothetical protein
VPLLLTLLGLSLLLWKHATGSIAIASVDNARAERLYWLTITCSQTLGTALGDWAADSMALGYTGAAAVFALGLIAVWLLYRRTGVSRTALFWAAFVLTRPLGAALGDWLDKPVDAGGLAFGRAGQHAADCRHRGLRGLAAAASGHDDAALNRPAATFQAGTHTVRMPACPAWITARAADRLQRGLRVSAAAATTAMARHQTGAATLAADMRTKCGRLPRLHHDQCAAARRPKPLRGSVAAAATCGHGSTALNQRGLHASRTNFSTRQIRDLDRTRHGSPIHAGRAGTGSMPLPACPIRAPARAPD